MTKMNDYVESKYLKRADVGRGMLLTIADVRRVTISNNDEQQKKWQLSFEEDVKPFLCNTQNGMKIHYEILGLTDDDDIETSWVGGKIVLFDDPTVMMGPKRVGGIRVRAPKNQAPKTPVQNLKEMEDDIPFEP